ncbi:MAG: hypothetical protein WAQ27_05470 [Candidatus Microsaccharimonas sp.]
MSDSIATILVIDMNYELYGPNGTYIHPISIQLAAAGEDGTWFKNIYLYPDGSTYDEAMSIQAAIIDFLDEYFEEGVIPKLVARSLHDVLRYFEQSLPAVADRLQMNDRIDVDTLMRMVPPMSSLSSSTPKETGSSLATFEVYLYFKEVFAYVRDEPPLGVWERELLFSNSDQPGSRIKRIVS